MTTQSPGRPAVWPGLVAVVAVAGFCYLFLRVEHQWAVAALAVCAVVAVLAVRRTDWPALAGAAWSEHPTVLGWISLISALLFIALFYENHFALLMLATVMLYSVACLGLTIQFGYAGVVNFAGAAFFGIGGYTAAMLTLHTGLPHLLVIVIGGLMAGLIGSVLVLPLLRTRGHYAAVITVAFAILFKSYAVIHFFQLPFMLNIGSGNLLFHYFSQPYFFIVGSVR